jgi:peptidylprolyl isomerase
MSRSFNLVGIVFATVGSLILLTGCNQFTPEPTSQITELKIDDIIVGDGPEVAKGDTVYVLYTGTLADETVFDSNNAPEAVPFSFVVGGGQVIRGWDEGLIGMRRGGTRKLSIPSELGYGDQSMERIPANSDLFFTIELLEVVKEGEEHLFEIEDLEPGTGREVKDGDTVVIEYRGMILNGKEFDTTSRRDKPVTFQVGAEEGKGVRAIPGIDRGVVGMRVGGKRLVRLMPEAAFGIFAEYGVPEGMVVIYEIELKEIK